MPLVITYKETLDSDSRLLAHELRQLFWVVNCFRSFPQELIEVHFVHQVQDILVDAGSRQIHVSEQGYDKENKGKQ